MPRPFQEWTALSHRKLAPFDIQTLVHPLLSHGVPIEVKPRQVLCQLDGTLS
ncbi:MAG: hypothetical protein ACKVOX_06365 [Rhizobacter sp.]